MIASKRQAPRHGPGRLVVDGADETLVRTARFALKPSKSQQGRLHGLVRICREVYNAALQHRRDAYRAAGVSVSWQGQFTALTGVREVSLALAARPPARPTTGRARPPASWWPTAARSPSKTST